jgi:cell division protein FtsN
LSFTSLAGYLLFIVDVSRCTAHYGRWPQKICCHTAGNDRNDVRTIEGAVMSKRLLIWIGLIILIGMISAAGWSVYVTVNRTATEAPPPPVRGKIPPLPQTSSGTTVNPAPAAAEPVQDQATTDADEQKPPAADTQDISEQKPRKSDPAPTDPSAETAPTTPQDQPMAESVKEALVESPADPVDADDSEAPPTAEPPPVKSETPAADAESESEKQAAQQEEAPHPMAVKQPEQTSDPSTSGQAPAATPTAATQPPADSRYAIQTGSYRNRKNAESIMSELSRKGYDSFIYEAADSESRSWFMVRFGHFQTFQEAQQALSAYQEQEEQEEAIITKSKRR